MAGVLTYWLMIEVEQVDHSIWFLKIQDY